MNGAVSTFVRRLRRSKWCRRTILLSLRADGSFVWLGRWDNVINSGGVKVQVEKVESAVEKALFALDPVEAGQRRFFVGPLPG